MFKRMYAYKMTFVGFVNIYNQKDDGDTVSIVFLYFIVFVQRPFLRVLINVLPYFRIIVFATDDVVVVGALEHFCSDRSVFGIDLFCNRVFIPSHYRFHRRGGVSPPVVLNGKQYMDMVGHDYIFINRNTRIFIGYLQQNIFCNQTCTFREGKPLPYNIAQNITAVFGAYRNKIRTVCAVIIFLQPIRFGYGNRIYTNKSEVKIHLAFTIYGLDAVFLHRFPKAGIGSVTNIIGNFLQ